jgi:hypothetical protein
MKGIKKLLVTTMLTVVTNVQAAPLLDVELNNQSIYAGSYVTTGDAAKAAGVSGNIDTGGAVTIADNATVAGDVVSKVSIAVTGKGAIDGDDTIAIDDGTSSPHVVVS